MKGTASLLRKLDKMKTAITDTVPQTVTEKLERSAPVIEAGYASAIFTGQSDVTASVTHADNEWDLTAAGTKLLFLEYGTGIIYPHTNPIDDPRNGPGTWSIEHSQYLTDSEKLAKYKGQWPDPYSGKLIDGNPSANVMYEFGKMLTEGTDSVQEAVKDALKGSMK